MRLAWTARAAAKLEEAGDYVASDSPQAAARLVDVIVSSVARLQEHAYLGKAGRIPGTRELVIPRTAYLCAYRVSAGRIEILAIRHGARDWPKHL